MRDYINSLSRKHFDGYRIGRILTVHSRCDKTIETQNSSQPAHTHIIPHVESVPNSPARYLCTTAPLLYPHFHPHVVVPHTHAYYLARKRKLPTHSNVYCPAHTCILSRTHVYIVPHIREYCPACSFTRALLRNQLTRIPARLIPHTHYTRSRRRRASSRPLTIAWWRCLGGTWRSSRRFRRNWAARWLAWGRWCRSAGRLRRLSRRLSGRSDCSSLLSWGREYTIVVFDFWGVACFLFLRVLLLDARCGFWLSRDQRPVHDSASVILRRLCVRNSP